MSDADAWGREDSPDRAGERILDAAEKAFAELGVARVGMSQIADFAGCSRGTLYRYFPDRDTLHHAFVRRFALEIGERVRAGLTQQTEPRARMTDAVLAALHEVRDNPATAAWFDPEVAGFAARLSRSSPVIEEQVVGFVSDAQGDSEDIRLRARWLVHVIVSLLASPRQSEAEERAMIERFVVPALLADGDESSSE